MPSTNQPTVAVVDDDPMVINYVSSRLALNGIRTLGFERTEDARKHLDTSSTVPDYFLLDMRLPGELPGSETFCNDLKARVESGDKKVTFITGNYSSHDKEVVRRTRTSYMLKTPKHFDRYLDVLAQRLIARQIKPIDTSQN